jgi:Na+-transporting methylmalonyl-CoA/oxaloacetate decarboxylase gamma subunit
MLNAIESTSESGVAIIFLFLLFLVLPGTSKI